MDGKITVKKYGSSDALVSDAELSKVNSDLSDIFNKGGLDGSSLRDGINSYSGTTTILLNDQGVNGGQLNGYLLTVDLGSQIEFFDHASGTVRMFSTQRIIAHELGHAVLGSVDVGPQFEMSIMGETHIMKSWPNVRATDRLMQGINGTVRQSYCNPYFNSPVCN